MEEMEAAIEATPELAPDRAVLVPKDVTLGPFLRDLAAGLRDGGYRKKELVVFVDQLERTFESGEQPDPKRLDDISTPMINMLRSDLKSSEGVRIIMASRKQYLADFLHSYQHASDCNLQFVILPPIIGLTFNLALPSRAVLALASFLRPLA